jgi:hypothetical protein
MVRLISPRVIGICQIAGSVMMFGGLVTGQLVVMLANPPIPRAGTGDLLPIAVLAAITLYAGLGLLRGWPGGWKVSILLQALQIPVVTVSEFVYRMQLGPYLVLYIGDAMGANAGFATRFRLFVGNSPEVGETFGANVLALCFFLTLIKLHGQERLSSGPPGVA